MRLEVGRAWAVALMLGILGAGAPAVAVEPSEQFFDALRELDPRYVAESRVKAFALCLDFDRSTTDKPVWQGYDWSYSPDNPSTHAQLANHALFSCETRKKTRRLRSCDCVIVARNNRFRLEANPEQLAKLETSRAPTLPLVRRPRTERPAEATTLPLVRRPQTEQPADHTPIAEPEDYSGMLVFGRGAGREWLWAALTVTPTVAGATFSGTIGSHQCRGTFSTEDRASGTWDGHCDGRGSLWGTLKLEEGFILAIGVEADGKSVEANLQRQ